MLPHNTPDWHNFSYYMVTLTHKKGAGVCFSAHPGSTGSRIASPHRIDNAVSPRQYELYIIKVYRNAPRDASVVICLLWLGICEIRRAQRQTFENVFLIYKTARFAPKD
jgi:hypothetical protein